MHRNPITQLLPPPPTSSLSQISLTVKQLNADVGKLVLKLLYPPEQAAPVDLRVTIHRYVFPAVSLLYCYLYYIPHHHIGGVTLLY